MVGMVLPTGMDIEPINISSNGINRLNIVRNINDEGALDECMGRDEDQGLDRSNIVARESYLAVTKLNMVHIIYMPPESTPTVIAKISHSDIVYAIDMSINKKRASGTDNALYRITLVSADRSGELTLWDIQFSQVLKNTLQPPRRLCRAHGIHKGTKITSVKLVVIQVIDEESKEDSQQFVIATCARDGYLKLWGYDLSKPHFLSSDSVCNLDEMYSYRKPKPNPYSIPIPKLVPPPPPLTLVPLPIEGVKQKCHYIQGEKRKKPVHAEMTEYFCMCVGDGMSVQVLFFKIQYTKLHERRNITSIVRHSNSSDEVGDIDLPHPLLCRWLKTYTLMLDWSEVEKATKIEHAGRVTCLCEIARDFYAEKKEISFMAASGDSEGTVKVFQCMLDNFEMTVLHSFKVHNNIRIIDIKVVLCDRGKDACLITCGQFHEGNLSQCEIAVSDMSLEICLYKFSFDNISMVAFVSIGDKISLDNDITLPTKLLVWLYAMRSGGRRFLSYEISASQREAGQEYRFPKPFNVIENWESLYFKSLENADTSTSSKYNVCDLVHFIMSKAIQFQSDRQIHTCFGRMVPVQNLLAVFGDICSCIDNGEYRIEYVNEAGIDQTESNYLNRLQILKMIRKGMTNKYLSKATICMFQHLFQIFPDKEKCIEAQTAALFRVYRRANSDINSLRKRRIVFGMPSDDEGNEILCVGDGGQSLLCSLTDDVIWCALCDIAQMDNRKMLPVHRELKSQISRQKIAANKAKKRNRDERKIVTANKVRVSKIKLKLPESPTGIEALSTSPSCIPEMDDSGGKLIPSPRAASHKTVKVKKAKAKKQEFKKVSFFETPNGFHFINKKDKVKTSNFSGSMLAIPILAIKNLYQAETSKELFPGQDYILGTVISIGSYDDNVNEDAVTLRYRIFWLDGTSIIVNLATVIDLVGKYDLNMDIEITEIGKNGKAWERKKVQRDSTEKDYLIELEASYGPRQSIRSNPSIHLLYGGLPYIAKQFQKCKDDSVAERPNISIFETSYDYFDIHNTRKIVFDDSREHSAFFDINVIMDPLTVKRKSNSAKNYYYRKILIEYGSARASRVSNYIKPNLFHCYIQRSFNKSQNRFVGEIKSVSHSINDWNSKVAQNSLISHLRSRIEQAVLSQFKYLHSGKEAILTVQLVFHRFEIDYNRHDRRERTYLSIPDDKFNDSYDQQLYYGGDDRTYFSRASSYSDCLHNLYRCEQNVNCTKPVEKTGLIRYITAKEALVMAPVCSCSFEKTTRQTFTETKEEREAKFYVGPFQLLLGRWVWSEERKMIGLVIGWNKDDDIEESHNEDDIIDEPVPEYKVLVNYHSNVFNCTTTKYDDRHVEYSLQEISSMLIDAQLCEENSFVNDIVRSSPMLKTSSTHEQICNILCYFHGHPQHRVLIQRIRKPVDMGYGLYAMEDIDRGSAVSEYLGEFMSSKENNRRKENCYKHDKTVHDKHYTFSLLKDFCPEDKTSFRLDDGKSKLSTIDATRVGNCSRFISHSCDPNLVAVQIIRPGKPPRIIFIAKRNIKCAEQLTIDYNPEYANGSRDNEDLNYIPEWKRMANLRESDAMICHCGSENCRKIVRFSR